MLELSTYRSFMESLRPADPELVDGLVEYLDALVESTMYEAKRGAEYTLGDRKIVTGDKAAANAAKNGDKAALDAILTKIAAAEDKRNKRSEKPKAGGAKSGINGFGAKKSTKKNIVDENAPEPTSAPSEKKTGSSKSRKGDSLSHNGYGLEYEKRWSSALRHVADRRGKHKLKEHGLVNLLGIPQNSSIFEKYKGRPLDLAEDVMDVSEDARQAHGRLSFTGNVRSDEVGDLFKKAAKYVSELNAEYKSDHESLPKKAKKKKAYGKKAQPKKKSTTKTVVKEI